MADEARGTGKLSGEEANGADLSREEFDAVIFDLDGVITDTAAAHFRAWKATFDEFLHELEGEFTAEFTREDYRAFVDGKSRLDGIMSFLGARGLEPTEELMQELAARKQERYLLELEDGDLDAFAESVDLVEQLVRKGLKVGLVSSSKNAARVLELLELDDLFQVRVDGQTLEEEGLRGKPAPDLFLEAARRLGVKPSRAVVVEDATSGVRAAREGGFSLVIGVSRRASEQELLIQEGADFAVSDLGELLTRH